MTQAGVGLNGRRGYSSVTLVPGGVIGRKRRQLVLLSPAGRAVEASA